MPKVTLQEMLKSCLGRVVAAYERLSEAEQLKVGLRVSSHEEQKSKP